MTSPAATFSQPSWRRGTIPAETAARATSSVEDRATVSRSISSLKIMTSCNAIRPR